jgi:hypothetical protein
MTDTSTETPTLTARDTRGRFQPGASGNPAGKKPGTLNHMTRFRLLIEAGDFEAAGRLIVRKMHEGNLSAARFIVDHVDPRPRGRPITLDVAPDASLVERYGALTRAMLAGEVSPQEAAAVARLLEREAALAKAAPASKPVVQPAPQPSPDLHSACKSPAPMVVEAPAPIDRRTLLSSVSRAALTAGSPASDLHPLVSWRAPPLARAA